MVNSVDAVQQDAMQRLDEETRQIMLHMQLNNICQLLEGNATYHEKLCVDHTGKSHREIVIEYDQKEKTDGE